VDNQGGLAPEGDTVAFFKLHRGVGGDQLTVQHCAIRRAQIDKKGVTVGIQFDLGVPMGNRTIPIASDLGMKISFLAASADLRHLVFQDYLG
jgi:hypothetical protein